MTDINKHGGAEPQPQPQPQRYEALKHRTILDGQCRMLTPSNITNSGVSDGGWMDRDGIEAVGHMPLFLPPSVVGPVDAFYSNDAWARPGFATLRVEISPPLETVGEPSTRANLTRFLMSSIHESECSYYQRGQYTNLNAPRIDHPKATMGSAADLIVQHWYEVLIDADGPDLPQDLTAITQAALVNFTGRAMVVFKANNFKRHDPPLDYAKMLSSIEFIANRPYLGPDPDLSGLQGVGALMRSWGGISMDFASLDGALNDVVDDFRREGRRQMEAPRLCFRCGDASLRQCSRCHCATYCGTACQSNDWKRHKKDECAPK